MRGCKKKLFAGALSLVMALSLSVSVFAARETTVGYAGSTRVTCELGTSGSSVYASVSASDYVDAKMEGYALFSSGNKKYINTGFSNRTYGDTSVKEPGKRPLVAGCEFTISSEDGEYKHYNYIN
ncbi:hypothetical protein [Lachnospira multipara]|uniref:Uncharacterized protein n=1 Tax=Lachnospira multipara TaxID=28051 RepID=A0A1H5UCH1_9FIRM|nr:hypothetical protein [Lachnospira multipara]SEF72684.1 hypothetical protein SAMN05216537_1077 [Lachnospira multipara]